MGFLSKLRAGWLGVLLNKFKAFAQLLIMGFYKDKELVSLVKKVRTEDKKCLLSPMELAAIYSIAKAMSDKDGDFAEVGTYRGSSSLII